MNTGLPRYLLIGLLLISSLLGGCATIKAQEPDKVTVQLSWFHSVEFAGFYAAQAQGFYSAENLAVTLLPGSPEITPWQEIAQNKVDFGVMGGDSLLIARSQGIDVKAVATIFRRSPIVLMSLAESSIKTPHDFVGKRVGIFSPAFDNASDIQLLAMLRQLNIDESEVKMVVIEEYGLGSLTSGAMDVYSGFSTKEPARTDLENVELNLIYPQDYGVQIYANVIAAHSQLIQERPELVERFIRATVKGYQYALAHAEEMPELAAQYDNNLNLEYQHASMLAEIAMIDTGDVPIGVMDEIVWQETQQILLDQGFISTPIDLSTVYTNEFVGKVQ